jgi:hypothetical protein
MNIFRSTTLFTNIIWGQEAVFCCLSQLFPQVDLDASELLQAVGGDVGAVPGKSARKLTLFVSLKTNFLIFALLQ